MSDQLMSEAESSTPSARNGLSPQGSEWTNIVDPAERRKIQNKLAQRRFREKQKDQREEHERRIENHRNASSAYVSPEPRRLDPGLQPSGLPWGGVNMPYILETGRTKDQQSQRSSRENSVYAEMSRTGGSSRLGLHLTDQFARGVPAWKYFPFPLGHPEWGKRSSVPPHTR